MPAVLSAPETQQPTARVAALHAPVRWALFLYLTLILCPLRFCAPSRTTLDNTWFFALNYAAAHHLVLGRDIFWTYGPLAYLLAPFAIGSNLAEGLAFQLVLWLILAVALWDLFRANFPLAGVAFFSFFLALSSLNYSQEMYPGNLLLPIALILLVHYHRRGGMPRLLTALVLMGLMPLFQFVGAVAVAGIITGFVLESLFSRRPGYLREITIAVLVPFFVSVIGLRLVLGSFHTVFAYLQSSRELASGYSAAMSLAGTSYQLSFVLLAFALLCLVFLLLLLSKDRKSAWFLTLMLTPPALIELRHGLVRQDPSHVLQFLCFVALALALLALGVPWRRAFAGSTAAVILFAFSTLWWASAAGDDPSRAFASLVGARIPPLVWQALHYRALVRSLQYTARRNAAESGLEPELRSLVGDQPVAYLSLAYSNALGDHLNLALLPVLQNYSAYTPALDRLNGAFIADRGPRFLAYESQAIDNRHTWLEAPATWDAVYRWYDTRALGDHTLLLERRAHSRPLQLEPLASRQVAFGQSVPIPASAQPVFWTLQCSPNSAGGFRAALYRIPEVTMTVTHGNGLHRTYRVVLPVLNDAPSPASYLPIGLPQVAYLLASSPVQPLPSIQFTAKPDQPSQTVANGLPPAHPAPHQSLAFSGTGSSSYSQPCRLQFFSSTP